MTRWLLLTVLLGAPACGGGDAPAAPAAAEATWTCSMHPQVRSPEPGQCPICGMDLVPAGDLAEAGDGEVVLSERARTLAQLRTSPVRRQGDAAAELRLLGRVVPDETRRKDITTWIGGRIDRLHVNVTGQQVRAGQVIATLYSPEVYAAHQDLLTARQQIERLAGASEAARSASAAALEAARERLRLLGVPPERVAELEREDAPTHAVSIRSPYAGTVIDRVATEGAYVGTGAPLYHLADLERVWVLLDAYEGDLPRLRVGQEVRLTVSGVPDETFTGRVAFLDPTLHAQRRTSAVRVEVPNPDGRLRPGMFAEATVAATSDAASPLVVPASAPLFTGRRAVVYVETVDGDRTAYAPRTVRLGPRLGDVYPVVSGLSEGERVVTRGAFALDADLQIRGGPSMMTADDDRTRAADELVELTAPERAALAPVVLAYLDVQRALAADDLATARAGADRLGAAAAAATLTSPGAAAAWAPLADPLRAHGHRVAHADTLEAARAAFEPLSGALTALLTRFGNPTDRALRVAYCPMAFDDDGASWVQEGATIDNAYFGAAMRTCGEVRATVDPGTWLAPGPAGGRRP